MKKSVVIVEDDMGLRKKFEGFLAKASNVDCLYSVGSAEEAILEIPKRPPDIIIMDIGLPKMSGIECVTVLKSMIPSVEIIILTVYEDTDNIFRALRAGASGYLIKSNRPTDLLHAINDINVGGAPLSGSIARKIIRHFQVDAKEPAAVILSPRETQILKRLALGHRYKKIASELGIALETVRTHVKRICHKLHVRSSVEAVVKYLPQLP